MAREDIAKLVERLRNLHEGPSALPDVVALGEAAVPALEALLRAPPQTVYHDRYLAADALAAIPGPASTAALTRALRDSIARRPDPASLESEGVIVNRIAEHLSHRADAEVIEALLEALRTRPYPHCALVLGRIGERRAIPLLIECLYDDAARSAAVEALRCLGDASIAPVIDALLEPRLVRGLEPPSRTDGRAAAARLLGELADRGTAAGSTSKRAAASEVEPMLWLALRDWQRAVRVEAALSLLRGAQSEAQDDAGVLSDAAAVLVDALDEPNWSRADTIMQALARTASISEPLIVPQLAAAPSDEPGRLRRLRSVEMAGRLCASSAVPLLAALSSGTDAALRLAAVNSLDAIAAADPASMKRFLHDAESAVRRRAAEALQRRGALAPQCAVPLLGDSDAAVRRIAVSAVREAGPSAAAALKRALYTCGSNGGTLWSRWRLWRRAWALFLIARRKARE